MTEGINVTFRDGSEERGDYVWLIDFANPENNNFCVVNQFTVTENHRDKRPDVILFINGLPLVVIELKNSADESTAINSAFKQLGTYKADIPSLFTYNGLSRPTGSLQSVYSNPSYDK